LHCTIFRLKRPKKRLYSSHAALQHFDIGSGCHMGKTKGKNKGAKSVADKPSGVAAAVLATASKAETAQKAAKKPAEQAAEHRDAGLHFGGVGFGARLFRLCAQIAVSGVSV
jgi:hypothetical protein